MKPSSKKRLIRVVLNSNHGSTDNDCVPEDTRRFRNIYTEIHCPHINCTAAQHIANKSDTKAVKELDDNLANEDKSIQSDWVKALYEIGERKPVLIAAYGKEFVALLNGKNTGLFGEQ